MFIKVRVRTFKILFSTYKKTLMANYSVNKLQRKIPFINLNIYTYRPTIARGGVNATSNIHQPPFTIIDLFCMQIYAQIYRYW